MKTNESKYKVGDKVRIKSLEWYKENSYGTEAVVRNDVLFTESMSKYCGKEATIISVEDEIYLLDIDITDIKGKWYWRTWMFEENISEENKPIKLSKKEKVLRYMLSGKSITQREAIDMFHSYRLADLIYKYKADGYEIETQMKRSNDANYAEYKIVMNDFAIEQANKRGINN